MMSVSKIRELVRRFVSNQIDLQSFADSFQSLYAAVNVAHETEALRIADQIESLLGRVSSGYIGEEDLHAQLDAFSAEPVSVNTLIGMSFFPANVNQYSVAATSSLVIQESFGTSPSVVFGSTLSLQD